MDEREKVEGIVLIYSSADSTGSYMAREEGLAAQSQLKHRGEETTMKYDHAPVEDRRDALDRMGERNY
jgi:hypothetical protein